MAERVAFIHKETKKRYILVEEKDDGTIVLENKDGRRFTQPFDKKHFKAMGYRPEIIEGDEESDD
jgi:hypothetical protein